MDRLDEHKRQPLALAQHQQCRSAHSLCSDCRGRGAYSCHHDWQDRLRSGIQHPAAVHRSLYVAEDGIGLFSAYASYIIGANDRALLRFRHIVYSGPVKGLLLVMGL